MNTIGRFGFTGTVLAASIALAIGSSAAMATTAPAASQLPGKGGIVSGHVAAGTVVNGQQTITIGNASDTGAANAVINWGSGSAINASGLGGFNIGATARLGFVDGSGHGAAVLNIDSSGNPSRIYGKLSGTGTSVFVANANGIVIGSSASLSSTAGIGLIANTTLAGTGADFKGVGSIAYSGSGGNVTVLKGASVNAPSVLIAGGGNVNIDLGALKGPNGSAMLSAGAASTGSGAADNHVASLNTSGALASGVSLGGFRSAGSALNSGTLVLGDYRVDGLLTNTGHLTLPAHNGAVHNENALTTTSMATFSSLTNDGSYRSRGVSVVGGDMVNNGKLWGFKVSVTDGNLINHGSLTGTYYLYTRSDARAASGADYSISNTGTITSYGSLNVDANRTVRSGSTTGSFTSTGTVRLPANNKLSIYARNDITLDGRFQAGINDAAVDLSPYEPGAALGVITLAAGGYDANAATPTFHTQGALNVLTPLVSSLGANLQGRQVKLMSSVSVVRFSSDGSAEPYGRLAVTAGASLAAAHDYAVVVGAGSTQSAYTVDITGPKYRVAPGDGRVVQPNVLLQGALSASGTIDLGTAAQPLSDIFSTGEEDASGLVLTGQRPHLNLAFTGDVGRAPDLRGSDFRDNYLPVESYWAPELTLGLQPLGYAAHAGTVNLLVDGNVLLTPPSYGSSPAIYGMGSATGPASIPNTRLVLQAAGNIDTGAGGFYWPGAVYLGTIGYYPSGEPATATLGDGTITLGGNFSNVLPGSIASDGGIEFITQRPMGMRSYTVTTNANSPISFGSAALTAQYASGKLGKGLFFGGKQGSNNVVNYGALDASMFRTDAPGG